MVVVKTSGGHRVVHSCHRLVRQHYHLHFSTLQKKVQFNRSARKYPHYVTRHFEFKDQNWLIVVNVLFQSVPYYLFVVTQLLHYQSYCFRCQSHGIFTSHRGPSIWREAFQLANKHPFYFCGWSFTGLAIHRGKVTHSHPLNKYSGHISVFTRTWPAGYCPIFTYGTRGRLSKTVACVPLLRHRTCNWAQARAPNATLSHPG